jgi:hypothetical protein
MKRTIVQEFGEANRPPLVRGYANAKVGHTNKKVQTHRIWTLLRLQSEPLESSRLSLKIHFLYFLKRKKWHSARLFL